MIASMKRMPDSLNHLKLSFPSGWIAVFPYAVLLVSIMVLSGYPRPVKATDGILLENPREVYPLTGDWLFNAGDQPAFAQLEFDDSSWDLLPVPGQWSLLGIENVEIAWYRKYFTLSPYFADIPLAIRVPIIAAAHEVYVNGLKIGESGKIGLNGTLIKKNSLPGVYLIPDAVLNRYKTNVIAVRVADDAGWGGFVTSEFFIGHASILKLRFQQFVIFNGSVSFVLGFLGLYFLVLFIGFGREKSFLYFSILALLLSVTLFGYFAFPYFVFDSYWLNHFAFHTGLNCGLIFGFAFVHSLFELPFGRLFRFIVIGCSSLFTILLLTPVDLFFLRLYADTFLFVALCFNLIGFLILFFLILKAIRQRKPGARTTMAGALVICLCFMSDIATYLFSLNISRLGTTGTAVFMIMISYSLFIKFSKLPHKVENPS